jgi:hypothetical protein
LRANNGYLCIGGDCDNLNLPSVDEVDADHIRFISEKEKPAIPMMQQWVNFQNPMMVAHVIVF